MEVLSKLGFDWKVALANLVNFLIIYYLLRNVVFKKLGAAIKERREKIQGGLDDAEKAKTALMMAENEKERILTDGHQEAKNIVLSAQISGEEIIEKAKIDAESEAHKIKQDTLKEIEILREHQKDEIKAKAIDLVVSGVEAVLKKQIDASVAEKMIKDITK